MGVAHHLRKIKPKISFPFSQAHFLTAFRYTQKCSLGI